jgi:hypothetical protein
MGNRCRLRHRCGGRDRRIGDHPLPGTAENLEGNTIADGLILWVRVRSPDLEERAQQILRERGGQAIRVHEIEIDKRLEDLPLSNLRPDPWLGGERLGHL